MEELKYLISFQKSLKDTNAQELIVDRFDLVELLSILTRNNYIIVKVELYGC